MNTLRLGWKGRGQRQGGGEGVAGTPAHSEKGPQGGKARQSWISGLTLRNNICGGASWTGQLGPRNFLQEPLTRRLPSASQAPCSLFPHPGQPGPDGGGRLGCRAGGQAELPPQLPHSLPPGPAPRAVSPSWASCCLAGCPEEPATEPPHRAAQRPGG